MKYRMLPGTQLNVSEVCLGSMTWGQQNSEAEAHAQLDYAVGAGHQLHRHRGDVSGAAERARRRDAPKRISAPGSRASGGTVWSSPPRSPVPDGATGSATAAPM